MSAVHAINVEIFGMKSGEKPQDLLVKRLPEVDVKRGAEPIGAGAGILVHGEEGVGNLLSGEGSRECLPVHRGSRVKVR